MTYLVDFYRTVFDPDAYAAAGKPVEDDLSRFLYPDAAQFLRDKENGAMIVSSMTKEDNVELVRAAFRGIPRVSVMYTAGVRKGDYLAPYIGMYGAAPVFADDTVAELESMARRCPQARLFEVRRDGAPGDGRWPVIRSLAELP